MEDSGSRNYTSTGSLSMDPSGSWRRLGPKMRLSLSSLFFLVLQVSSGSEMSSRLKWSGNNNNWATGALRAQGPDLSSPLHVAQCRATCLQKFNNRGDGLKASSCFQHPNCFTCWKSCELLESSGKSGVSGGGGGGEWKSRSESMCLHPRLCLSGCQVACRYFEELGGSPSQAALPTAARQSVLSYSDGKIHWPRKPNQPDLNQDHLVFLVIQQYPDQKWRQITQTTLSEVDVPRGLSSRKPNKLRAVCVLVVSPDGLVAMFYPQSSPDDSVTVGSSSETTTALSVSEEPSTVRDAAVLTHDWNLRKVSLSHQKFLVIAELTWNHLPGAKDYLITWELDGGGLKGHLVTDSTTVTLSLWPDTVYHIQVELFGEEESLHRKSFPVAVDTSEAGFPLDPPLALKKESAHKSVTQFLNVTLLLTVSSAVLLLLCLGMALQNWARIRSKGSRDSQLLQHMEHDPPDTKDFKSPGLSVAVISPASFPPHPHFQAFQGPSWSLSSIHKPTYPPP